MTGERLTDLIPPTRDRLLRTPLCEAPFTNLYFDRKGDARACCWNAQTPVGNVRTHTIEEMWSGPAMTALRESLAGGRFAVGCDFCALQAADGVNEGLKLAKFDRFRRPAFDMPQQIEFSISNACNLGCIMCDGAHSSWIRAHREREPPIPPAYTDAFLDALRPYLAAAHQLKFLGGEPFLVRAHYRMWEGMVADRVSTRCHVTTNGTQFGRNVERMLSEIPFSISLSLDAARADTFEAIRVNAKFSEVLANARRFVEYTLRAGTSFGFTFCLMRSNWREFGEACRLADDWGVGLSVNTVLEPEQLSLYALSPAALGDIVDVLALEAPRLSRALSRNKNVWFGEFERLHRRCRAEQAQPPIAQAGASRPPNEPGESLTI